MSLGALRLLGRRRAFYVLVAGLLVYMVLVGGRLQSCAPHHGHCLFTSNQVDGQVFALNTLSVTGLLMTGYNPLVAVGRRLSTFLCGDVGLILYATPMQKAVKTLRVWELRGLQARAGCLLDAFLVTLAAQSRRSPCLRTYFKNISLLSLNRQHGWCCRRSLE